MLQAGLSTDFERIPHLLKTAPARTNAGPELFSQVSRIFSMRCSSLYAAFSVYMGWAWVPALSHPMVGPP